MYLIIIMEILYSITVRYTARHDSIMLLRTGLRTGVIMISLHIRQVRRMYGFEKTIIPSSVSYVDLFLQAPRVTATRRFAKYVYVHLSTPRDVVDWILIRFNHSTDLNTK